MVHIVLLKLVHICGILMMCMREGRNIMIRYKIDVNAALKNAGYTTYRIRKDGLINQTALQKIRDGKMISWEQLNSICRLLNCQPGDLVEYVEDDQHV